MPILDNFPNAPVRHRKDRGGRLCSLGSARGGSSSAGSSIPSSSSGFSIQGVSAEAIAASRTSTGAQLTLKRAQDILVKRKTIKEDSEEEDEDGSLIKRPRARRRVTSDDEAKVSHRASSAEPVHLVFDDDVTPQDTRESIDQLFYSVFDSGDLGPILDEVPLSSFSSPVPVIPFLPALVIYVPSSTALPSSLAPPLIIPPPVVHHTEVGSMSRTTAMGSVTIEVPANSSLLRKSGQADVWLEPLIGSIEKEKMNIHSCLTLMNDIVHATLKANLIGTKLMGRISLLEKVDRDSKKTILEAEKVAHEAQLEAANWKGQFDSAQMAIKDMQENRNNLEQQVQALTLELAVTKAFSSQAENDKECLESSFSDQLSKANEDIKDLKALLSQKEVYEKDLAQSLTQTQMDLRASTDKIRALESFNASLQISFDSTLAENEELKSEIAVWERDYELLEDKIAVEVSWTFLNSRRDALTEASQENFNLESELAKVMETIQKAQQPLDFPSPTIEAPVAESPETDTALAQVPEVEAAMDQAPEGKVSVTLAHLIEHAASSQVGTVLVAAPSDVSTVTSNAPTSQ
uniref:Uncharacterized protein LOC104232312 n=1 Tax=Nicotiana sylvestris TaxID=4096 RepID=A0A1U7X294_NICSY|nr:PREDICTED: uncharacterized protein LOC104232312 [Nicotiana sylvestris]